LNPDTILPNIQKDVNVLIEKIAHNKSLVSAIVTSLVKKMIDPQQDIRLHRIEFERGYSARVLDTRIITPFFKEKFPRYANKESSFLTLATREPIPWTMEEGQKLKIKDPELKTSFLTILDQVEIHKANPQDYLTYIFAKLIELSQSESQLLENLQTELVVLAKNIMPLNIYLIVSMLHEHFKSMQTSRLPTIAIYSTYELLMNRLERFKNKRLVPSSDKQGLGVIEIYTADNQIFEAVEIKHNLPIDQSIITDIVHKIQNTTINRYYLLTTYPTNSKNPALEREIITTVSKIHQETGLDIITDTIHSTLTYTLRFLDNYNDFITTYTKNLIIDAKNSPDIRLTYLVHWKAILQKHQFSG
ncbi:MAG: DNA methyltransferase, partial [Bacteroidia bacterium]|nr:DNA methyltransferase [Bacteroidia bacterium]